MPGSIPPSKTPPVEPIPPGRGDKRKKRAPNVGVILAGVGILLLLVLAGLVAFWLPGSTLSEQENGGQKDQVSRAIQHKISFEDRNTAELQKERTANIEGGIAAQPGELVTALTTAKKEWLKLKAKAALERVEAWHPTGFKQAIELEAQALTQETHKNFKESIKFFKLAKASLSNIINKKDELFSSLLKRGNSALDRGSRQQAEEAFQKALLIYPDSKKAQNCLKRAATIDEVRALLQQAAQLMEIKDYQGASRAIQKALAIDPLCSKCAELQKAARFSEKQQLFRKTLGKALELYSSGRLVAAEQAVKDALSLFPSDSEARTLFQQIQQEKRVIRLKNALNSAQTAEKQENFDRAIKFYQQALSMDSHSVQAKKGLNRVTELRSLMKQLIDIVSDPLRLSEPATLTKAKETIKRGSDLKYRGATGLRFNRALGEAERMVRLARNPVQITFSSDGKTSVTILRIGRLGQFHTRQIALYPGRYTVLGTRPGYVDQRKEIKIVPGSPPLQVKIRCTDPV